MVRRILDFAHFKLRNTRDQPGERNLSEQVKSYQGFRMMGRTQLLPQMTPYSSKPIQKGGLPDVAGPAQITSTTNCMTTLREYCPLATLPHLKDGDQQVSCVPPK
jgi:hypothetical protein